MTVDKFQAALCTWLYPELTVEIIIAELGKDRFTLWFQEGMYIPVGNLLLPNIVVVCLVISFEQRAYKIPHCIVKVNGYCKFLFLTRHRHLHS